MKTIILTILICVSGFGIMAQTYRGETTRNRIEQLNNEYCSPHFKSVDGTILDLSDESNISATSYINILDWMEGRVAGMQVYNFRAGLKVPFIRGTQASIYVDEMPVDAGYLNVLPVSDIAFVKVIKGPFAGSVGGNHVIAVYTWQPEEEDVE